MEIYGNPGSGNRIIQLTHAGHGERIDSEIELIRKMTGNDDFCIIEKQISDWNNDIAPWPAAALFGRDDFGDGASKTLSQITEESIPEAEERYLSEEKCRYFLCGYSLAGLFSLWAAYNTDVFSGVAAVSPSVWYPGWIRYAGEHDVISGVKVYLSLGDKEERTKNPVMRTVGEAIRDQYRILQDKGTESTLEFNPGNHFADVDMRMAKGIVWLLKQN